MVPWSVPLVRRDDRPAAPRGATSISPRDSWPAAAHPIEFRTRTPGVLARSLAIWAVWRILLVALMPILALSARADATREPTSEQRCTQRGCCCAAAGRRCCCSHADEAPEARAAARTDSTPVMLATPRAGEQSGPYCTRGGCGCSEERGSLAAPPAPSAVATAAEELATAPHDRVSATTPRSCAVRSRSRAAPRPPPPRATVYRA